MRSKLGKEILEYLSDAAMTSAELFVAIIEAGYGASHGQIMRKLDEVQSRRGRGFRKPDDLKRRRANFYSTLYRLKKQGLVSSKENKWIATQEGKDVLSRTVVFKKEPDDTFRIVVFDIPENIAYQRVWIRSALKNMGFKLLQRSVWIGKVKLSEEFIKEIKERNLIEYVEILGVVKEGSIKDIE